MIEINCFDRVNPIQQQIIIEIKNKHKLKRLHHRKRVIVQYTTHLARKEAKGRRKIKWRGFKFLFFLAKPFTIGGFYIAPEEETDKENIDISSFSQF